MSKDPAKVFKSFCVANKVVFEITDTTLNFCSKTLKSSLLLVQEYLFELYIQPDEYKLHESKKEYFSLFNWPHVKVNIYNNLNLGIFLKKKYIGEIQDNGFVKLDLTNIKNLQKEIAIIN